MAKMNGVTKIISIIVTLLIIFAGLIANWTRVSLGQRQIEKDYELLKKDGTEKARENEIYIIEIRRDLQYQRESLGRIEAQQKEGFLELKELIKSGN